MIFIMSLKQWQKNKKKLVEPKDYMILDGTDDDDAKLSAFTNVVTMDAFCPPVKLLKLASKDDNIDDIVSIDKIEELEDRFFEGNRLRDNIMATVSTQLESDINMFLILRNKAYKIYGKKIRKGFLKLFNVGFPFVVMFSGKVSDHKKELNRSLSDSEKQELRNILTKLEKQMEKSFSKKKRKK